MADFLADLGGMYGTRQVGNHQVTIAKKGSNLDLDMTDFITLMITQLTNQGIDDTMDTSEMLNQMVQMQMIQSMVNMTDATTMNYAGSLLKQEVTVGKWVDGKLEEIYGEVEAIGTMDGQPVVFVNGEYYYLSEIMAIGRLPKVKEPEGDDKVEGSDQVEDPNGTGSTENPKDPDETEGAEDPKDPEGAETVQPNDQTETPENDGSSGTPNDIED